MNKRKLYHAWKPLKAIKPRYFLLAAAIASLLCVVGLRYNYQRMSDLRQAVYTADKNGSDVQKPLQELQAFVTAHMNTSLSAQNSVYPPIQLQYTYERLTATGGNGDLYTQAQAYCQGLNSTDFSGRNRVPCIQKYVSERGAKAKSVPASLYQFDFVSPKWSPDLAGWSLVFTLVFLLIAIGKWLLDKRMKAMLT